MDGSTSQQRFTLNITRADMVRMGYSPSVRLFEAAACGTPIISDYWPGLETIFRPERHILVARSADDVLAYLRELPDVERRQLGDPGPRARARPPHRSPPRGRARRLCRRADRGHGIAPRRRRRVAAEAPMKLVIFGLSVSSSWGNGHAVLWRAPDPGLCRARPSHRLFRARRALLRPAPRPDTRSMGAGSFFTATGPRYGPGAQSELADADAGMVTSYCPDALAATELVLSSPGLHVFYDLDTPVTLTRLAPGQPVDYIGPDGLAAVRPGAELHRGTALTALRRRLGARRVAALYGSVDPDRHRPRRSGATSAPRCPISAPMPRTAKPPSRHFSSSRRGSGRGSASSSAAPNTPAIFRGPKTSISPATCRPQEHPGSMLPRG